MNNEYPKQLYRKGWDDLSDTIVVRNEEEEGDVRAEGFRMLSEPEDEQPETPEVKPARAGRKPKAAE